jgi:hypothetical protein
MNRMLVGGLLLVVGLIGLFMAACGGFFTLSPLLNLGQGETFGFWIISIPSLVIGTLLLRFSWQRYEKFSRNRPPS